MALHEKYILKVTGGPTYDAEKHISLAVNTPTPLTIETDHISARVHVRIQEYRGLPQGSPSTSPYFAHALHKSDRYSIAFTFTPKKTFNGNDLVFGNDFDHPIRDRLPTGFSYAFRFVKWWIDPGLYGDPYADEPHLYGPLLSSINVLRIGSKRGKDAGDVQTMEQEGGDKVHGDNSLEEITVFGEGAEQDGEEVREKLAIPDQGTARMTHFLDEGKRREFEFEEGRTYACDFFNPYLDFNDFSLKLPGFTLPIVSHWDGQPLREHSIRYVLKNRATDEPLFVVVLTLLPAEGKTTEAGPEVDNDTAPQTSETNSKAQNNDDEDID